MGEPRTGLGRRASGRSGGLTESGREHLREAGREKGVRNLRHDPEHQRWARGHHSREDLSRWGRLGYQETASRYGAGFARAVAAGWRREHPTAPEREMIGLLGELGLREGRDYEREAEVGGRRVDIALHERALAIEVYGGVHEREFREWLGTVESGAEEDRRHVEDVEAAGYWVLVVRARELEGEARHATRERLRRELGGEAQGSERGET